MYALSCRSWPSCRRSLAWHERAVQLLPPSNQLRHYNNKSSFLSTASKPHPAAHTPMQQCRDCRYQLRTLKSSQTCSKQSCHPLSSPPHARISLSDMFHLLAPLRLPLVRGMAMQALGHLHMGELIQAPGSSAPPGEKLAAQWHVQMIVLKHLL